MELNFLIKILNFSYCLIIIIGLAGNTISFIIFSCKKFQRTIFSTYFRFLSVFDSIYFIFIIIKMLIYVEVNLYDLSSFSCKIIFYLNTIATSLSIWTMVIISFDRMFSIVCPNRFQFRKRSKFQFVAIAGIIIYNSVYNCHVLFLTYHTMSYKNQTRTILTNQTAELKCEIDKIQTYFELANATIVPFLLMMITTIIMLIKLFRSRRRRSQQLNTNHQSSPSTKRKDVKFAIITISLNLIFLTFNLPLIVSSLLLNYLNDIEHLILDLFLFLFQCNYSSLFYVNLIVNSLFRKQFFNLIKLNK